MFGPLSITANSAANLRITPRELRRLGDTGADTAGRGGGVFGGGMTSASTVCLLLVQPKTDYNYDIANARGD